MKTKRRDTFVDDKFIGMVKEIGDQIGIQKQFTPRDLRHIYSVYFVNLLCAQGVNKQFTDAGMKTVIYGYIHPKSDDYKRHVANSNDYELHLAKAIRTVAAGRNRLTKKEKS